MISRISRFTQTLSKGVEDFSKFTTKHLSGVAVKIVGLIAIIFGLAVFAATAYGLYKMAMWWKMPNWIGSDYVLLLPYSIWGILGLGLGGSIGVLSLCYGIQMMRAKPIVSPQEEERPL